VESAPLNELARTNGVKIDEKCLLYTVQVAPWALAPEYLSVPAPPEAAFGVLTRAHEGVLDASGAARRLLSEAITGTLVVNGQEVMSVPVTYDASAGPQLLSVSPAMISAAMPEVRFLLTTAHWCLYLDAEVARLSWFHAVWASFADSVACRMPATSPSVGIFSTTGKGGADHQDHRNWFR
jgi:hypothetical protein